MSFPYRVASSFARSVGVLSFGAALVGSAGTYAADTAPRTAKVAEQPYGWLLTIKGNVVLSPNFPGAKSYGFIAYPSLSLRRAGTPDNYSAPDDGVSIALFGDSQWAIGFVGKYQSGRYRENDRRLYGIRDAKWALEPGLYGEFWALADTLRVRGEMRYGINGYNGLVGTLALDYVQRVGKFVISGGPRVQFAGSEYMDTYFGVTGVDALQNRNVTQYKADPGVKSVGVAAAATYRWNDQWSTTVRGGYDRLVGGAADSPIVRNLGSKDQFTLGASASYTFPLGYAP
ncbi:MipA/OmpV family protein [uncultured Alsobacter sp.]|uniref:MipA/OmpV family protein n=1 Tax=uncultured Alsobacter sp. TaxID=1748258 RepID=UPI0025FB984C|nr:MipA/OmpV family protein [uncultured Alsobacter sp.]